MENHDKNTSYGRLIERFPDMEKVNEYELKLMASEVVQIMAEDTNVFEFKEILQKLEEDLGKGKYSSLIKLVVGNSRLFYDHEEKPGENHFSIDLSLKGMVFSEDSRLNQMVNCQYE